MASRLRREGNESKGEEPKATTHMTKWRNFQCQIRTNKILQVAAGKPFPCPSSCATPFRELRLGSGIAGEVTLCRLPRRDIIILKPRPCRRSHASVVAALMLTMSPEGAVLEPCVITEAHTDSSNSQQHHSLRYPSLTSTAGSKTHRTCILDFPATGNSKHGRDTIRHSSVVQRYDVPSPWGEARQFQMQHLFVLHLHPSV